MDEPAEQITTVDVAPSLRDRAWARWHEVQTAMRSAPVVVRDVLGKESFEVMPRDDEQVIERQSSRTVHTDRSANASRSAHAPV